MDPVAEAEHYADAYPSSDLIHTLLGCVGNAGVEALPTPF
jgi:hypothetical protein